MRCGCGAVAFIFSIYLEPVLYVDEGELVANHKYNKPPVDLYIIAILPVLPSTMKMPKLVSPGPTDTLYTLYLML